MGLTGMEHFEHGFHRSPEDDYLDNIGLARESSQASLIHTLEHLVALPAGELATTVSRLVQQTNILTPPALKSKLLEMHEWSEQKVQERLKSWLAQVVQAGAEEVRLVTLLDILVKLKEVLPALRTFSTE